MNGTVETPLSLSSIRFLSGWSEGKERKEMESVKEKAANVAASAKAGMEKTKATVQEKVLLFISN